MKTINEIWLPVVGYEEAYSVSNTGKVRTEDKYRNRCKGKILKGYVTHRGYLRVGLWKNCKMKNGMVHRLVAQAFIPNTLNKAEVHHKDGNKLNNYVSNLEWISQLENIRHAYRTGLNKGPVGEYAYGAILKDHQVITIRHLYSTGKYLQRELGVIYGISARGIGRAVRRETWKHI